VGEVPAAVTVTFTVPVASGGLTAVMTELLWIVNDGAAVAPNMTALAPAKLSPVTVTEVPPVVGPVVGLIEVTVGAGVVVE